MDLHILMVVSNDVVHDSRVLKEARALRDAGHDLDVVGWDRSGSGPPSENREGVAIHRIRTDRSMRLLRKDLFRNPLWWRRATRLARRLTFDAIHCHDLDTLPVGVRLKRVTGKPLVYDCHEVFGYMIEADVPGLVVNYAFRMERRLAPEADRVIAVNDAVGQYIERASHREVVIVRNCHDVVLDAYRAPPGSPFTILYLGTLHASRFVLSAIEVVAEIPEVRLILGGSKQLTPTVRAMCAEHPNTQFLGMVPAEEVLPRTLESHAVLSMFDPRYRINQVGLPNKIFEAMAAGRPSIVAEGLPMAALVEREGCGIVVPYSKEGLRGAIRRLRDDPKLAERLGRNGLSAAQREYNWDAEKRKLIAVYDGLGGRT